MIEYNSQSGIFNRKIYKYNSQELDNFGGQFQVLTDVDFNKYAVHVIALGIYNNIDIDINVTSLVDTNAANVFDSLLLPQGRAFVTLPLLFSTGVGSLTNYPQYQRPPLFFNYNKAGAGGSGYFSLIVYYDLIQLSLIGL